MSPLETPSNLGRVPGAATVFPSDLPVNSLRSFFSAAAHFRLWGATLIRWLLVPPAALALLWATGWLPGGLLGSALWAAFALAAGLLFWRLRRQDFVRFSAQPLPTVVPSPLPAAAKLPIYVSGAMTVEGRCRRFTAVPGFYRTFSTREHALLCRQSDRRLWRLLRRREEEIGMWYVFFTPAALRQIRWGVLTFTDRPQQAVAVDYRLALLPSAKHKRERLSDETVYIAFDNEEDGRRILADLLVDTPPGGR